MKFTVNHGGELVVVPEMEREKKFLKELFHLESGRARPFQVHLPQGSFSMKKELLVKIGTEADIPISGDVKDFLSGMPEGAQDSLRDLGLMEE